MDKIKFMDFELVVDFKLTIGPGGGFGGLIAFIIFERKKEKEAHFFHLNITQFIIQ